MKSSNPEKFFGICKICGNDIVSSNKIKSHALTNAVYFNNMPLNHGGHLLVLQKKNGRINKADAGKFEKETGILCEKCDKNLKIYEDERTKFIRENTLINFNGQLVKEFTNYDSGKIKLAFLADIFRCSCFKKVIYDGINLGKFYENKIREILFRKDTANNEFPIHIIKFKDASGVCKKASMCPYRCKVDGINHYNCLMPNGWMWRIKIDKRISKYDNLTSFKNNHILIYDGGDIQETSLFKDMLKLIQNKRN